jgi:ATPase
MDSLLPDKSALLLGINKYIDRGIVRGNITIAKDILTELEKESEDGDIISEIALDELSRLGKKLKNDGLELRIVDFEKPFLSAIINACKEDYILVTADENMQKYAEASGIKYVFLPTLQENLAFEKYIEENTMSVHLKENSIPKGKVGIPGNWRFVDLDTKVLTRENIEEIAAEIINAVGKVEGSFIEDEEKGFSIIQLGKYRIVIIKPPLSDGWEITITKAVTQKKLSEYNLPPALFERLKHKAEGIIIAGAPGMGKTTFAQALAEFYVSMNKVVKTIESPRDMQLPPEITQYSKHYINASQMHDILLLSRPDYTVFDEMRNDEDFKLYVDLRLAGIGMIGVMHATSPIDAIHRFINRLDIGTITNVVDTIIFIQDGNVKKAYTLEIKVKVPEGMNEEDLARPVVVVRDLITNAAEYEIYVFGEQTMIIPTQSVQKIDAVERRLENIVGIVPGANIQKISEVEYRVEIPQEYIDKYNKKINSKLRKLQKRTGKIFKIAII